LGGGESIDPDFLHRFFFSLFSPKILIAGPYKSWGEKQKMVVGGLTWDMVSDGRI
jgi:hypothetical protein